MRQIAPQAEQAETAVPTMTKAEQADLLKLIRARE
jgi:hypothetical protein